MESHNKVHPKPTGAKFGDKREASTVSGTSVFHLNFSSGTLTPPPVEESPEPEPEDAVGAANNSRAHTPPLTTPEDVAYGRVVLRADGEIAAVYQADDENIPKSEVPTVEAPDMGEKVMTLPDLHATDAASRSSPEGAAVSQRETASAFRESDDDSSDTDTKQSQLDDKQRLVVSYWHQVAREGEAKMHQTQPSKREIYQQIDQILTVSLTEQIRCMSMTLYNVLGVFFIFYSVILNFHSF